MKIETIKRIQSLAFITGLLLALGTGCKDRDGALTQKRVHHLFMCMSNIKVNLELISVHHSDVSTVEELVNIFKKRHEPTGEEPVTYYINPDISHWKILTQWKILSNETAVYVDLTEMGIKQGPRYLAVPFRNTTRLARKENLNFDVESAVKLRAAVSPENILEFE